LTRREHSLLEELFLKIINIGRLFVFVLIFRLASFFRGVKIFIPRLSFLLFPFFFLVTFLLLLNVFLLLLSKEMLTSGHCDVLFPRQLFRRERCVFSLLTSAVSCFVRFRELLPLVDVLLFELRHEATPIFLLHFRVFRQFFLDHELLNSVNGMHILHAINNDAVHVLEILKFTHRRNCVTLHQNIAIGQELKSFQSHAFGTDQSLATLNKFVATAHNVANLNDFAEHFVVSHKFDGLLVRHRPSQHLN